MSRRHTLAVLAWMLLGGLQSPTAAAPFVDAARGALPIPSEATPPRLGNAINDDQRPPRNHRYQPPLIPHRVDGYQADKNFNKCMDCHAPGRTAFSNATPVSASHYQDRSGKVLNHVSSRRYFCQQCHVAQDAVPPIVGNRFKGDDAAIPAATPASAPRQP